MRRGGQFGAEAGAAIDSRGMRRRAKKPGGLLLIQPGTEHFLIRPGSGHFLLPLGQLCKARCRPFHQFPQLALLGFFFHGAGWQGFGTTFPDRHRPQGAVSGSRLGQAARGRVLAPRGGAAPGRRRRHPRPPSRRPRPRACRASRRGARAGCRRTDRDAPCPPPAFPPIELACGAPARPSGRGAAKAARRMREAAARLPGSPRNAGASGRARACPSGRYRAGRGPGCGKSRPGRAARPAEPGPGRPPPPRAGPGPGLLPWRSAPRKSIAAPIFSPGSPARRISAAPPSSANGTPTAPPGAARDGDRRISPHDGIPVPTARAAAGAARAWRLQRPRTRGRRGFRPPCPRFVHADGATLWRVQGGFFSWRPKSRWGLRLVPSGGPPPGAAAGPGGGLRHPRVDWFPAQDHVRCPAAADGAPPRRRAARRRAREAGKAGIPPRRGPPGAPRADFASDSCRRLPVGTLKARRFATAAVHGSDAALMRGGSAVAARRPWRRNELDASGMRGRSPAGGGAGRPAPRPGAGRRSMRPGPAANHDAGAPGRAMRPVRGCVADRAFPADPERPRPRARPRAARRRARRAGARAGPPSGAPNLREETARGCFGAPPAPDDAAGDPADRHPRPAGFGRAPRPAPERGRQIAARRPLRQPRAAAENAGGPDAITDKPGGN